MLDGNEKMPPWASIECFDKCRHKVLECEARIRAKAAMPDRFDVAERALCLLYTGKLAEALSGYVQADELAEVELQERYRTKEQSAFYNQRRATIHLLLGDTESAKRELLAEMEGIRKRSVNFTDAAGGVDPGLLLWYIAIREEDRALEERTLKYLKRVRKSKRKARYYDWPKHIADMVLRETTFEEILADYFKCTDLDELERRANTDVPLPKEDEFLEVDDGFVPDGLALRNHLARTLFYGAVDAGRSNVARAEDLLRRCTRLRDVDMECEWYLAFLELKLFP